MKGLWQVFTTVEKNLSWSVWLILSRMETGDGSKWSWEKKKETLVGLSGRGGESALWVHLWKSRLLEETTSRASSSFSGCSREWARKHPFNGGSRSGLEDPHSMAAPWSGLQYGAGPRWFPILSPLSPESLCFVPSQNDWPRGSQWQTSTSMTARIPVWAPQRSVSWLWWFYSFFLCEFSLSEFLLLILNCITIKKHFSCDFTLGTCLGLFYAQHYQHLSWMFHVQLKLIWFGDYLFRSISSYSFIYLSL